MLTGGQREEAPALGIQFTMIAALYDEMLSHHGVSIGRRHARKHLGWALDAAAATAGVPDVLLKDARSRVLTADDPPVVRSHLGEAFDLFGEFCDAARMAA